MKILIILSSLLLVSCGVETEQSTLSENYKNKCTTACRKDFGTDVDWIGILTGKCYCK